MTLAQDPKFNIRPAVSADISRLVAFEHTCKSNYVWQIAIDKGEREIKVELREVRLPRTVQVPYPRDPRLLPEEWSKHARTFVAVYGGMQIGYIRFLEQESAASVWVLDLVVDAASRRNGVAAALIQRVESWAQTRHIRQFFIEVSSKNHPGISLMQQMGFRFSGYNEHYYYNQDVALFFGKVLSEF